MLRNRLLSLVMKGSGHTQGTWARKQLKDDKNQRKPQPQVNGEGEESAQVSGPP
jgi:hypothetical protein